MLEFGNWFAETVFKGEAFNAANDGSNRGRKVLKGYKIIEDDGSDRGFNPLDQCYVKAYSTVTLKIQNITEADDSSAGASMDKHRIDANPIVGKMYKFSTPYPVLNNGIRSYPPIGDMYLRNEYILAQDPNGDGVVFPQDDLEASYRTPVPMTYFDKCSSVMSVRMQPGEMKTASLSFKFDGKLSALMNGFYSSNSTSDPKLKGHEFLRYVCLDISVDCTTFCLRLQHHCW